MKERLVNWWLLRTTRERALISMLGVLLFATFIWLLVWRPVESHLEAARAEQAAALDRLERVHAMVADIRSPRPAPSPDDVSASALQAATEAGFALVRNEPQPQGGTSISVSSVKSRALFTWLGALEQRGVIVQSANVTANGDGTVAFDGVLRKSAQ